MAALNLPTWFRCKWRKNQQPPRRTDIEIATRRFEIPPHPLGDHLHDTATRLQSGSLRGLLTRRDEGPDQHRAALGLATQTLQHRVERLRRGRARNAHTQQKLLIQEKGIAHRRPGNLPVLVVARVLSPVRHQLVVVRVLSLAAREGRLEPIRPARLQNLIAALEIPALAALVDNLSAIIPLVDISDFDQSRRRPCQSPMAKAQHLSKKTWIVVLDPATLGV